MKIGSTKRLRFFKINLFIDLIYENNRKKYYKLYIYCRCFVDQS